MSEPKTYGAKCHRCSHIRHGNEPVEVIGELTPMECPTCHFCAEHALHRLLMANGGLDLFDPEVRAAVKAFQNGKDHVLLDQLRAECLLIEEENRGPEYVEFRGERWFVADARFDEADSGGHWHLTITNGTALAREFGEGIVTPLDRLVQAAAEASCTCSLPDGSLTYHRTCEELARRALAAAFAALPAYIEENPPEPIVVGRHPQWFRGFDDCLTYLAREFREPT